MESPPRLSEKARPADDDTVICRSSFSVRSKIRTVRGQSVFSPVPRRDGYNTPDFVPKSCASRSLWTPSAVYGMSGNVRYFRGRVCPSIYRTYRTLPYTDPPQQEGLPLLAAAGPVADTVLLKQNIMLGIQPPHDPVRRKAPALQLLCQLRGIRGTPL